MTPSAFLIEHFHTSPFLTHNLDSEPHNNYRTGLLSSWERPLPPYRVLKHPSHSTRANLHHIPQLLSIHLHSRHFMFLYSATPSNLFFSTFIFTFVFSITFLNSNINCLTLLFNHLQGQFNQRKDFCSLLIFTSLHRSTLPFSSFTTQFMKVINCQGDIIHPY